MTAIRVLVVDDAAEIRAALETLIAAAPELELVGTADGVDEAASLAGRLRPDVAVVDVKMPGGGGPAAAREIIRLSPETRVVAFSAHDDRASVFQMLRSGAVSYLVKGATVEEIRTALASAARGESTLAPAVASEIVHEFAVQLEQTAVVETRQREQISRIRQALETGGFEVVFQPIVELSSREPIGFEALARFSLRPPRPANEWFAEAKAVGLDIPLEAAAIGRAIAVIDRLPPDTFVSVNVDPNNLTSPSILNLVATAPPERVVIELTEHTPVHDYRELAAALLELRAQGLRIAVDDAGAGFASLRHVVQLAPDLLKIDTSLTAAFEHDRATRAMIVAFVAFSNDIQIRIVAEGIENERTAQMLGEIGIRYGQGYAFGRPAPLPRRTMSNETKTTVLVADTAAMLCRSAASSQLKQYPSQAVDSTDPRA